MKYRIIKKCQLCNSHLINFLDLGKQPLCDDLKNKPNENKFYKLQIKFCKNCLTAFQKYNINKTEAEIFAERSELISEEQKTIFSTAENSGNKW